MGGFKFFTSFTGKKLNMATSGWLLLLREDVAVYPKGFSTRHVVHINSNYFTTSFPGE